MSHIVLSQIKDKSVNLTAKKKNTTSENKRKTVIQALERRNPLIFKHVSGSK